jgi:hypothetical protein
VALIALVAVAAITSTGTKASDIFNCDQQQAGHASVTEPSPIHSRGAGRGGRSRAIRETLCHRSWGTCARRRGADGRASTTRSHSGGSGDPRPPQAWRRRLGAGPPGVRAPRVV